MKKPGLLLFGAVLFTAAVLCGAMRRDVAAATGTPRIVALDPVFDFGKAFEGRSVTHVFEVKNEGSAPLTIKRVHTSCGCTAAEPSRYLLQPGQNADIAVTFDTRFQKGERARTIDIFSDDPKTPMVTVTLKGLVQLETEAAPSEIDFGKLRQGAIVERDIVISDLTGSRNFKVGPVSNSNPNLKITQTARKDGKPGATVHVALLKSMPIGPFNDTVKVETSRRPVRVHLFGRITGDIELTPAQISFGIVPHGQGVMRVLTVTNQGTRPLKLTGVSSSSNSVAARIEAVSPGKKYRILVELRKDTPDGQLRGKLAITTDNLSESKLTVTYFGIVGAFSARPRSR